MLYTMSYGIPFNKPLQHWDVMHELTVGNGGSNEWSNATLCSGLWSLHWYSHLRTCSLYVHTYKVNDEAKRNCWYNSERVVVHMVFGIILVPQGIKAPFRMHSDRARDVFLPQSWPTKSFGKREGLQHPV